MKTYPLFKVHVQTNKVIERLRQVFDSGYINEGVQVTQLTNELRAKLNVDNLILTNSCTSAITLALHMSNVRSCDEVISTPMTCVATNTPIIMMGAKIVWADIDPNNGMIDPDDVVKKITNRTKAVIAVAWAGSPPRLQSLKEICDSKGIKLILDAAHAFDARYENKHIHEWADFTCYSFQAIKHFTTGDGGALISRKDDDYQRSKSLKWFGLDRDQVKDSKGNWKGQQWDSDIVEAGYKFNMNNVAAAIGLCQLEYIDEIMSLHRQNAATYNDLFKTNDYVMPLVQSNNTKSSFWAFTVKIKPKISSISRDNILSILNNEGIGAGVIHVPNDEYTAFEKFKTTLPGVREFSANQFSLPCGWWLNYDDINHIASRVINVISQCE